jgi:DNA-binding IclR family transcriptional regulator
MIGVVFLAAPVFESRGVVCGSLSMGIPKPRYTGGLGKQMAKELMAACRELSTTLEVAGYIHEKPR